MKNTSIKQALMTLCFGQAAQMTTIKVCLIITSLMAMQFGITMHWATLPATFMIVGIALGACFCLLLFHHFTARSVYLLSTLIGFIGVSACFLSFFLTNFILLTCGTFLTGIYAGCALNYRFTAANLVKADKKPKVISYIILSGIVAAFVGPVIVGVKLFSQPFVFAFIVLLIITLISFVSFFLMKKEPEKDNYNKSNLLAELSNVIAKPNLIKGSIISGLCYLVMSLIMVATPLAMHKIYHFDLTHTTFAMQLHFIGMFGPSLFTGFLIKRFGAKGLMLQGVSAYVLSVIVLESGISNLHFDIGLFLLGLGWNFLFVGATTFIAQRFKLKDAYYAQGVNNVITTIFSALGALLSGPLLFFLGWQLLCVTVIPFCAILVMMILYSLSSKDRA
jgi:predicted MFS family arabinose efflux permease